MPATIGVSVRARPRHYPAIRRPPAYRHETGRLNPLSDPWRNHDTDDPREPYAHLPIVTVLRRNLFLDFHGAAHRAVYAVEHDQQRIPTGLDDPATVLLDRWIDQVLPQSPQPLEGSRVIKAD
jgi:hypothetical protein